MLHLQLFLEYKMLNITKNISESYNSFLLVKSDVFSFKYMCKFISISIKKNIWFYVYRKGVLSKKMFSVCCTVK